MQTPGDVISTGGLIVLAGTPTAPCFVLPIKMWNGWNYLFVSRKSMRSKFLKELGSYERDLNQIDAQNEWFELGLAGKRQEVCSVGTTVKLRIRWF